MPAESLPHAIAPAAVSTSCATPCGGAEPSSRRVLSGASRWESTATTWAAARCQSALTDPRASAPSQSTAPKRGPRRDRTDVVQLAASLGLSQRLNPPPPGWSEGASERERASGEQLIASFRANAAASNVSDEREKVALNWLALFRAAYPNRVLFYPLGGEQHYANAVHNEESMGMVREFIRRTGSRKPGSIGKPLSSDVVSGYVSSIRQVAGLGAGYQLYDPRFAIELPRSAKFHRRLDGARTVRKLERGLRAQHFAAAAANGFDRSSRRGIRRWARDLVAHNLLLRGGEPGTVEGGEWMAEEGHIAWASVTWLEAGTHRKITASEAAAWIAAWQPGVPDAQYPCVRVFVTPIKLGDANRQRPIPLLIRRRQLRHVPMGVDPVCAFDALLTLFLLDEASVEPVARATTPLFSESAGGVAVTTKTMSEDARAIAKAAGLENVNDEFGGKAFRIGGAEDYYDVLGPDSERIIEERGRWKSDIHLIYQRCSATRHLAASAAIGESRGISLEALGDGWAQPGR